ncbi:MAG: heme exporter protein CcmD [Alphaproteobacteria bacterium]
MGGYGPYIWSAYGITALVLGGLLVWSWRGLRSAERREAELGKRGRRRRAPQHIN